MGQRYKIVGRSESLEQVALAPTASSPNGGSEEVARGTLNIVAVDASGAVVVGVNRTTGQGHDTLRVPTIDGYPLGSILELATVSPVATSRPAAPRTAE